MALACALQAAEAQVSPSDGAAQFWTLGDGPGAERVAVSIGVAADDAADSIELKKSYLIPPEEIIGFDFLRSRFNRHREGPGDFDATSASIRRNLRSSWVVDNGSPAATQEPF